MPTGAFLRDFPLLRNRTSCTTRGTLPMIEPSTRLPSLAIVAYARVMSSGLTATAPRPIEK